MKVRISKNKSNLFNVCIEEYKCGRICKKEEDIPNYIFEKMRIFEAKDIDIYLDESISEKEEKKIISLYRRKSYERK